MLFTYVKEREGKRSYIYTVNPHECTRTYICTVSVQNAHYRKKKIGKLISC
jgi:hypothetical protein